MPAKSGLEFNAIQHLFPDHKSLMVGLLWERTDMLIHRGEIEVVVRGGKRLLPAKKRWIVGNRHRETLALPKHGAAVHAAQQFTR